VPAAVYEHCILEKGIVDTMCSVVLWNIAGGAAACSGSMLPAVRFVGRQSPVASLAKITRPPCLSHGWAG
jgi:hypothetical protein